MIDVDTVRQSIYGAARQRYDNVYVNPVGVVVVPHGLTSVYADVEADDGLTIVSLRAPVLQNLRRDANLVEYVALQRLRLGSFYFYAEGDGYDLDVESRTLAHWTSPPETADLIAVIGATAEEQALRLRPRFGGTVVNESGKAERRIYAEATMAENSVVAKALVGALDTQRTTIMGAAEGAWTSPGDAVLGRVVFAMTATDLWLAGWPRHSSQPAVWRIPYTEITEDHVRTDQGATDYVARVDQGRWLGVRMIEPEAAEAVRRVRGEAAGGSSPGPAPAPTPPPPPTPPPTPRRRAPQAEAGAPALPANYAEELLTRAGFPVTEDNLVAVQERLAMVFTQMARGYFEQFGSESDWATFSARSARPSGDLHTWPQTVLNALCRWDGRIVPHTQDMPERAIGLLLEAPPGSFFGGSVDHPLPRSRQFGVTPTRLR